MPDKRNICMPCRYCGGAENHHAIQELQGDVDVHWIVCGNYGCRATGPRRPSIDEAWAAWAHVPRRSIRPLADVEAEAIRSALRAVPSKTRAAKLLGIGRATLYRRIAELEL